MEGQDRLWITQPDRSTCLARVLAVRGPRFAVDRALFAPRSRMCRHPQYADNGTVWVGGEKRRLQVVQERGDTVWYILRGITPGVGQKLQCELDQKRRILAARAHTAMHLLMPHLDDVPMVADPEVKGGGSFRLTYAWELTPDRLAEALRRTDQAVQADTPVARRYLTRSEAEHVVTAQNFQPPDPIPGPDVVPVVETAGVSYPCDGSHVERTGRVGRVVIQHARLARDGFVVVGQIRA